MFLQQGKQNKSTLEHQNNMLEGMSVVESWIVEDEKMDKSRLYGLKMPVGTWVITMKVDNDEVWEKVKENSIRGFSIEGYFSDRLAQKPKKEEEELSQEEQLINKIKEVVSSAE